MRMRRVTVVAAVGLGASIWATQTDLDNSIAADTTIVAQEISAMIRGTLKAYDTLEDEIVIQVKGTALEPTASICHMGVYGL